MPYPLDGKSSVILLAEDNPADTDIINMAFDDAQEFSKYFTLKVVENGKDVVDYLRRKGGFSEPESSPRPDIIFMDINMPLMDGKQTLHEVKNDSFFNSIPIVMLTTSSSERDISESYNLGANAYITKPPDIDEFIWMIQSTAFDWLFMVKLPQNSDHPAGA